MKSQPESIYNENYQEVQDYCRDLNDLLMSTYGAINRVEPMKFQKSEANSVLEEAE